MPDMLTHILLGKNVHENLHELESTGDQNAKMAAKAIASFEEIFLWGTQGPDVFFYHNFWPWRKQQSLRKLGNKLHVEKTGSFFAEGLHRLKTGNWGDEDFLAIFSYLCGCLCHFALDKTAHPFIYRYTGFVFENGEEKGEHAYLHQKFEAMIDCLLWKRFTGRDAYAEPIHRLLRVSPDFPGKLDHFFREVIQTLYGIDLKEDSLPKACRDMSLGLKLIFDPENRKKKLLAMLEELRGKELRLPRPLYPLLPEGEIDYLNEKRSPWAHPLNEQELSTVSFLDILEESKAEATLYIRNAAAYLRGELPTLTTVFKDLSYLTNKEWGTEEARRNTRGEGILPPR
jgi:hypothetical protein